MFRIVLNTEQQLERINALSWTHHGKRRNANKYKRKMRSTLSQYSSTCGVWPPLNISQSDLTVQVTIYEREDHVHTFLMVIHTILISSKMYFKTGLFAYLHCFFCLCCQLSHHGNISRGTHG